MENYNKTLSGYNGNRLESLNRKLRMIQLYKTNFNKHNMIDLNNGKLNLNYLSFIMFVNDLSTYFAFLFNMIDIHNSAAVDEDDFVPPDEQKIENETFYYKDKISNNDYDLMCKLHELILSLYYLFESCLRVV